MMQEGEKEGMKRSFMMMWKVDLVSEKWKNVPLLEVQNAKFKLLNLSSFF